MEFPNGIPEWNFEVEFLGGISRRNFRVEFPGIIPGWNVTNENTANVITPFSYVCRISPCAGGTVFRIFNSEYTRGWLAMNRMFTAWLQSSSHTRIMLCHKTFILFTYIHTDSYYSVNYSFIHGIYVTMFSAKANKNYT